MLFDGQSTSKPDKKALVNELEKTLNKQEYSFKKENRLKSLIMVEFMLQVRKISLRDKKTFRDVLNSLLQQIQFSCKSHLSDVIYDSYLESSAKKCERVKRAKSRIPLQFVLLTADTNIPVEMDQFKASNKNKELLQVFSRN